MYLSSHNLQRIGFGYNVFKYLLVPGTYLQIKKLNEKSRSQISKEVRCQMT